MAKYRTQKGSVIPDILRGQNTFIFRVRLDLGLD
jgi:hypothetical protein